MYNSWTINNMNLNTVKIYQPQSQVRRVLLAIHGLAGSKNSRSIAYIANLLLAENVATVAIDLPGHGDNHTPLSLKNCLGCISEGFHFVKERYAVPVTLYAASFGAYLSLLFILRIGNPFRQIILRSPAVEMAKAMVGTDRKKLSDGAKKIISAMSQSFKEELLKNDLFELETVDLPLNVIHGWMDGIVSLSAVKRYLSLKAPQAKLTVIETAGHNMRSPEVLSVLGRIVKEIIEKDCK